jgi:hypothetical protein
MEDGNPIKPMPSFNAREEVGYNKKYNSFQRWKGNF